MQHNNISNIHNNRQQNEILQLKVWSRQGGSHISTLDRHRATLSRHRMWNWKS